MKTSVHIEYNYITGYLVDILECLGDTINSLKAFNAKVKVGITRHEPVDFFREQLIRYDWDRMVILYDTSSKKLVNVLKKHLININWLDAENENKHSFGNYTLYALIRE